jgi:hypothetical protein
MSGVGGRRCKHELCIRGDIDVPVPIAGVGDRDTAHLRIVFGRHQHLQHRRNRGIDAHKLRAILREGYLVPIGFDAARLVAGGPHYAAVDVTQKKVAAQIIARRVFTPPGYREISPAAITGARCGEHHRVVPVRQQVRLRNAVMRGVQPPHVGDSCAVDAGRRRHFLCTWVRYRHLARRALLQKQFSSLNHGF